MCMRKPNNKGGWWHASSETGVVDHKLLGEGLLIEITASSWLVQCDGTSLWWQHQGRTAGH